MTLCLLLQEEHPRRVQLPDPRQGTIGDHQCIERVGTRAHVGGKFPDIDGPSQSPLLYYHEATERETDEMGRSIEPI